MNPLRLLAKIRTSSGRFVGIFLAFAFGVFFGVTLNHFVDRSLPRGTYTLQNAGSGETQPTAPPSVAPSSAPTETAVPMHAAAPSVAASFAPSPTPTEEAVPVNVTAPPPAPSPTQAGKININTADAVLLQDLPGIGPVYAERILAYRAEHGVFGSVEALVAVDGIGEATVAKLKPFATVGDDPTAPPPSPTTEAIPVHLENEKEQTQ